MEKSAIKILKCQYLGFSLELHSYSECEPNCTFLKDFIFRALWMHFSERDLDTWTKCVWRAGRGCALEKCAFNLETSLKNNFFLGILICHYLYLLREYNRNCIQKRTKGLELWGVVTFETRQNYKSLST